MSALMELFPDVAVIRRTGVINAWCWPAFWMAIEATGRKKLIIAAISDSTCIWGKERCPEGISAKYSDFKFILMCSVFLFSNGDFFVCGFFRSAVHEGLYRFEGLPPSRPEAARPESGLRPGSDLFAS